MNKNYGPFCDNPRCTMHSRQVPEGLTFLNTLPKMLLSVDKLDAEMPVIPTKVTYEQIHRYQVGTTVKGLTIKGRLCETCMEVLRMFEGWP